MASRANRPDPKTSKTATSEVEVHPGDVVRYVQEQLLEAQLQREAQGLLPLFEVAELELEMRVCLTTRTSSGGALDLKMLAITKDSAVEEQFVHTIRLKLQAVDAPNDSKAANGRRPSARRVSE